MYGCLVATNFNESIQVFPHYLHCTFPKPSHWRSDRQIPGRVPNSPQAIIIKLPPHILNIDLFQLTLIWLQKQINEIKTIVADPIYFFTYFISGIIGKTD